MTKWKEHLAKNKEITDAIYCGCVTDHSFHEALLERYPNRRPGSKDSSLRRTIGKIIVDLPEYKQAMLERDHKVYHAN